MIQKCINCKGKFEDGQEGEQEDFLCVSCDSAREPYPERIKLLQEACRLQEEAARRREEADRMDRQAELLRKTYLNKVLQMLNRKSGKG